jgi:hypothetical protein
MRCPVCKADNVQPPQCRRCKADLTLLFDLEDQRRWELDEARRSLAAGRWDDARRHADRGDWLRRDDESARLAAVARLLTRDFAGAWQLYRTLTLADTNPKR